MSAIRETQTKTLAGKAARDKAGWAARAMDLLGSVRFGVVLLVLLAAACMVGMLVMQVNVDGFEKYYAALTPSQRLLYGTLGFFDIYHSWYFNAMLLVLSLNIILSSIDFFPKAWAFISRKKLDASAHWLSGQEQHAALSLEGETAAAVAEQAVKAARSLGLKTRVSEKGGAAFVFAERGAWNRLGAYAVHAALLTIFVGGFMTSRFGHTGQMFLRPGETSSEMTEQIFGDDGTPSQVKFDLPFQVECTDIQQKLLEKQGGISPMNTLDWLTRVRVKDPGAGMVYAGFILLTLTLAAVFLFSHQRVWARIEPRGTNEFEVIIGGNTNRNKLGFEDRFGKLVKAVSE
jgi:cytochrome c biogenesis protein